MIKWEARYRRMEAAEKRHKQRFVGAVRGRGTRPSLFPLMFISRIRPLTRGLVVFFSPLFLRTLANPDDEGNSPIELIPLAPCTQTRSTYPLILLCFIGASSGGVERRFLPEGSSSRQRSRARPRREETLARADRHRARRGMEGGERRRSGRAKAARGILPNRASRSRRGGSRSGQRRGRRRHGAASVERHASHGWEATQNFLFFARGRTVAPYKYFERFFFEVPT